MATDKTTKEKIVIIFFALALIVLSALAVINPKPSVNGDQYADSGEAQPLDELIATAKKRVTATPKNLHALVELGELYLDNNQVKESMNTLLSAYKLEPQSVPVLVALGKVYQRSGFNDKSFDTFKNAEILEPNNITALYFLGMLNRYHKKNNKEAIEYFEAILAMGGIDPKFKQDIAKEVQTIKAEAN